MGHRPIPIELTLSACGDLEDILRWYREQGAPQAGQKLVEGIFKRMERLRVHPDSGRVVPEFEVEKIWEVLFPPFRIVYQRGREKVTVVRVWRSERLMLLDEPT
jgi:plasmid stabilization system protein ParE